MGKCFLHLHDGGRNKSFAYTYTGDAVFEGDPTKDWTLTLKTSGTLTITDLGPCRGNVEVFLVGAGGGGSTDWSSIGLGYYGSGAGGGYTKTIRIKISKSTQYQIVVGQGGAVCTDSGGQGGTTSAFGVSAEGGQGGYRGGRNGGSGGAGTPSTNTGMSGGGQDGGDGQGTAPGKGQGTTTRAFGSNSGTAYSAGGYYRRDPQPKTANTGDGGDGYGYANRATAGASGVVIIRNAR